MRKPVLATVAALASLVASSCSRVEREPTTPDQSPSVSPSPSPLPSPVRGAGFEVAIMSAVVADDCQTAELAKDNSKAKAKMAPGGKADMAMKRACEQSRVQIRFHLTTPRTAPAHIEVVSVKLSDEATGKFLQDLVARNPQQWSDAESRYLPWDSTVSPGPEVKSSFDLSAPNWVAIGNGDPMSTQGMTFRLEVLLRIDGADRKVDVNVRSPFIMREPNVKT